MEIEDWLKNSILGIVFLGALGSLLAVLLGRLILIIKDKIAPAPYRLHKEKRRKRAYVLGYSHATIENDTTGRRLITFLVYRSARLVAAFVLFLLCVVLITALLVFQAQVTLSLGIFLSVTTAFLALYWAHFEFEYIYRTYLWVWKKSMQGAEKGYEAYTKKSSAPSGNTGSESSIDDAAS